MTLTAEDFMKIDFEAQLKEEYRERQEEQDRYYKELGREIEEHPIYIPRMHRGA